MDQPMLMWNVILTLIVMPIAWFAKNQSEELKRVQILLNITREEYLKRTEHSQETDRIMEALRRLEDKIDRIGGHKV